MRGTEALANDMLFLDSRRVGAVPRWLLLSTLLVTAALPAGCSQVLGPGRPLRPPTDVRAIWVTRWDYRGPQDIRRIMEDCRSLGLNTVLFQVRGAADAFYRSRLEPRAEELRGAEPLFDPLATAIREAHARQLQLHAWVNVLPLWKGRSPPKDPHHLYHRRPEWRLVDQFGRPQPLGDHYVLVNPCRPEVRRYLAAVLGDIVSRYAVDGLHLDYIRFVTEEMNPASDYPYDARTVSLYRRATGRAPAVGEALWKRWRSQQIDALVKEISAVVGRRRPGAMLSAAVFADRSEGKRRFYQNGERWLANGWVDAVFPMIYRDDSLQGGVQFAGILRDWQQRSHGRLVVAGIGVYKQREPTTAARQIELAGRVGGGFALFSYGSMFSSPAQGLSQDQIRAVLASDAIR